MSRSNDAGHFFQTSEALATTERKAAKSKNKHGNPIKLPSKILAVCDDRQGGVYTAEAAGEVKRVALDTGKLERIFTQGTAPLTCVAIGPDNKTIYTGSWDKTIYAICPSASPSIQTLTSHTDFIKCLLPVTLSSTPLLLSGSADATIILWNLTTSKPLHKLKGHTKALQNLAIDPESLTADSFTLFSASSDREIRRWYISLEKAYELEGEEPILAHETSVYALRFDGDGDLWTASADKTAKHLIRSRGWEADTTLQHPDFVRDVLPFEDLGLVVTACRDEEVRVWEMSSGALVCTYSGHFEEITGLASRGGRREVVSVSIDGTVRVWSLERGEMEKYLEEVARGNKAGDEGEKKEGLLTAEEEAELAELMEDDD
ncbi:hypothetical protein M409DRAFT_65649 [Zasmidium cellare ATCC 36951]|uniref:Uncharacterized protein n=1 Tax=Zasmidium cellare ATCC 36951 TaxID=1080233 RepID=A0A6A6CQT5_ZASCE|nr:uncharacterized protein M409DRAFT_65649 [Zasmidium cellare ATCC 36951]KAF2168139.1 hypothetical protein M409DRAFT_65649 [Zasmidium cellare ATCC 36951]